MAVAQPEPSWSWLIPDPQRIVERNAVNLEHKGLAPRLEFIVDSVLEQPVVEPKAIATGDDETGAYVYSAWDRVADPEAIRS